MYDAIAKSEMKSIMKMIAVHFHEHFEDRPFLKWKRELLEGKFDERRLFRTGRTGTGVPKVGCGLSDLSILSNVLFSGFPGLLHDEFDL